ncbi:MAG: hypothetical protein ACE5I4_04765 [Thermoplasmata archaeon]
MEKSVEYFDRPGFVNSKRTLELARGRALELGRRYAVVASVTGRGALRLARLLEGASVRVVCVTFRAGTIWRMETLEKSEIWDEIPELSRVRERWKGEGVDGISGPTEDTIEALQNLRAKVVTATDLGWSIDASLRLSLGIGSPVEIIKETLRLLCPGFHVAMFATMTAADAGAIPVDEEVVAVGGTEYGLDTALVIKPSYSDQMFDRVHGLEVREVVCKPRSMKGPSGFYLERGA